jgi:subtilisin family serine protease
MKLFITLWISFVPFISWAQEVDRFTEALNGHERELRMEQMRYVPNEVLVKFRDEAKVNSGRILKSAGINGVDRLLQRHGAEGLEKLFPSETKLKAGRVVKDPLGRDLVIPSLHNTYKIIFPELKSTDHSPVDILAIIQELNSMPEVDYAEPNYLFSIGDFKATGPEMSLLEAKEVSARNKLLGSSSNMVPNDPLYDAQWGIPATKIDIVWNTTTGDNSQVIAIIDTGVDWGHPDLSGNIWANQREVPDNGVDDDGNGYIDDIRGWDFINMDNNPLDDNSHGTHVAGIAAAVGNNGIGIAGVNWKARIMPLKVFQSSGNGDVATIAQGINYSVNQGATVLNMSFGSYV